MMIHPSTRRRGAVLGAGVAVLLALSACSTVTGTPSALAGTGPSSGPNPGADDTALATFLAQKPTWGPCTDPTGSADERKALADPRFDCTTITAPLDYTQPSGTTAKIALSRQKALDPKVRIGSLLLNPGGPGGSGVGFLPQIADAVKTGEVAQKFDLVGFDPRGIGGSTPTIDCSNTAEIDAQRTEKPFDSTPQGVAADEAEEKAFAQRCVERTGKEVLENIGTRDVVRDLRIIHKVLGDDKLNYMGYSYGTAIGAEFAAQFPTDVRVMTLDGAVDRARQVTDPVGAALEQPKGFQLAFTNFATACAAALKSQCPVGADPKGATAVLQKALRPLITTPVPAAGAGTGRTLGYNDASAAVLQSMYSTQLWDPLAYGLQKLSTGDGSVLLQIADILQGRNSDGSYSNLQEDLQAVSCVDSPPVTDRKVALDISTRTLELAPLFDTGYGPSDALDVCAFWPVQPTGRTTPIDAAGLPTTLVVSSLGDPATPYENGRALASQLGSRLLTVDNNQHTVVLQGLNKCADAITTRYLVDAVAPAHDPSCAMERPPAK
jgi:pimeloyl-ACP methyl ester carboxylesterase